MGLKRLHRTFKAETARPPSLRGRGNRAHFKMFDLKRTVVKAKNLPALGGEILRFAWGDMTTLRLTEYWYRLVVIGVAALFLGEVFDRDQNRFAEPPDQFDSPMGSRPKANGILYFVMCTSA